MGNNKDAVLAFIESVPHARRRRDAYTLLELMERVTGDEPRLEYSTIIGFGRYHYRLANGTESESGTAGFSPRKASMCIYLPDGVDTYTEQLQKLGPHKTGLVCLYINDLEKIDLGVLKTIITESHQGLTSGTHAHRTRKPKES